MVFINNLYKVPLIFRTFFYNLTSSSEEDKLEYWRERIFISIFLTITIFGIFIYIPSVILSANLELWWIVVADTAMYFWIISVIAFRHIPFKIRAINGSLVFYTLGLLLMIIVGPAGAGFIWLFVFPVITGILLGLIPAIFSLVINLITLTILGLMIYSNLLHWEMLANYTAEIWIVTGLSFIFLNIVVSISLSVLLEGLKTSMENEKSISSRLEKEHIKLVDTNRQLKKEMRDRQLSENEKKDLKAQLLQAQKIESIGTLAGGIAHDFNNILSPIIGFTEMTMDDVPESSTAARNLQEIYVAANRAKNLVKQILEFSRTNIQDFKPIKIQDAIEESLNLLRASIPSTIEIVRNIDDNCRPIMGDSTQIHQSIMNLFTNAYHAMPDSRGKIEISLEEIDAISENLMEKLDYSADRYARLSISDTGHGIGPAILERIFEPYFTTKEKGKGTGLGLSVVHGIVKSHKGDILVHSEPGKGTRFDIYLPLIDKKIVESEKDLTEPLLKGSERILLVDDEEQILFMEKQMLERLGYSVEIRTSSVEALKLFRFKPDNFDLVITDMTMPNMTGLELSKQLLSIRPYVPIILCTGYSETITKEKAKAFGISAFVMKPITMNEISKIIRQVLDKQASQKPINLQPHLDPQLYAIQ